MKKGNDPNKGQLPDLEVAARKPGGPGSFLQVSGLGKGPVGSTDKSKKNDQHVKPVQRRKNVQLQRSTNGLPSKHAVLPAINKLSVKEKVLRGTLEDLPSLPSTVVRVFLSSTFSDMRAERDELAKTGYPRLKAACRDLGLDFQIVDMRWGVTDDATNDHSTEKLCISEIRNCQMLSFGPNFVSFLGDRYGYRPFPLELEVEEFEAIKNFLPFSEDEELLQQWYRRDDNNVPPMFTLQPIRTNLPYFGDPRPEMAAQSSQDKAEWWRIFRKLQLILRETATVLADRGRISREREHQYFMSVTEEEITTGIFQAKDIDTHCLCYIRELVGIQDDLDGDMTQRHLDLVEEEDDTKVIDTCAAKYRTMLHDKVSSYLSSIKKFQVQWESGGINPVKDKQYLESFCDNFVSDMMSLVQKAYDDSDHKLFRSLKEGSSRKQRAEVYREVLHHLHFAQTKCELFCGQDEILSQIKMALLDKKHRRPVVLHAPSGVGKTSVVAKVMEQLPYWFDGGCIRVLRFLGTSPDSTNILSVLLGICWQLAMACKVIMPPGMLRRNKVIQNLQWVLRTAARSSPVPIVILLDSVDQLSPASGGHSMKWVPKELPSNICMVISTLTTDENDCRKNLVKELQIDCENGKETDLPTTTGYFELRALPVVTAQDIMKAYFKKQKRALTDEQQTIFLEVFEKSPSPLFLKLLLDQAKTWRSYTEVDRESLATTVRDAILQLFIGLENKYGELLIQKALGYITVGLNGLTEIEIEDALSCTDDVLSKVYVYHDPPVEGIIRIPPLLWARVYHDIKEYLVQRQGHGKITLNWYHRQFIEAATERYTMGENAAQLHSTLVTMFSAEDSIRRTITLEQRDNKVIQDADRQITLQQTTPNNRRKLMCLPYHLVKSKNNDKLKSEVLFNINFLVSKITAFSLQDVLEDIRDELDMDGEDEEILQLHKCLLHMDSCDNVGGRSSLKLPVYILGCLPASPDHPRILSLQQQSREYLSLCPSPVLEPLIPCLMYSTGEENSGPTTLPQISREHGAPFPTTGVLDIDFSSTGDKMALIYKKSQSESCVEEEEGKEGRVQLEVVLISLVDMSIDVTLDPGEKLVMEEGANNRVQVLFSESLESPGSRCLLVCVEGSSVSAKYTLQYTGNIAENGQKSDQFPVNLLTHSSAPLIECKLTRDSSKAVFILGHREQGATVIEVYDIHQVSVLTVISLQQPVQYHQAKLTMTDNYIGFQIHITPDELFALRKKEGSYNKQGGANYKFWAVDLRTVTGKVIECNRILMPLPMRGNCFTALPAKTEKGHGERFGIGIQRQVVVWRKIEKDKCDIETVAGQKENGMFYRGTAVTDDPEQTTGGGRTTALESSLDGSVVVSGSDDGYVIPFDGPLGRSINNRKTSPSTRHAGEVSQLVVSSKGHWIASWCQTDHSLRLWQTFATDEAWNSGDAIFGLPLSGLSVKKMSFSKNERHLGVIAVKGEAEAKRQLLLFRLGKVCEG